MYYRDLSCYVFDYSALALSQLGPLLELSTRDCSSTHNNTAGFTQQRPIGSCTSYGQPWLYCTYIIYICCRLVIIMYMYRYIKLSTCDCSSTHNNTACFTQQRPIGSCTSYGQPWLYCTYIIYICCSNNNVHVQVY